MTHEQATNLIQIYGNAWETQDADLILTIFTDDASYYDPKEKKNFGRDQIRDYGVKKVQQEQKDITFKLLNLWIDGDTVIAEWNAEFIDIPRSLHIDLMEVAIFTVRDGKFSSIREYYKSVKQPL